jgi:nucleoside-diphosphate-sugar epimerase
MNAVVSGSHGFIGTHLVNRLVKDGYYVVPIEQRDLFDIKNLTRVMNEVKPSIIFHLASYGNHYNQHGSEKITYINIVGTYNMFMASKDINYSGFYNFSTSSITLPIATEYSVSKHISETLLIGASVVYDKPVINIRPYSVYGPGESVFRFIPRVIECMQTGEKMVVDEDATHDWIFIDSFIDAVFMGETEIGTGIKTMNIEIIQMLEEISGKKLKYQKSHGKLRDYDNDDWFSFRGVKHVSLYEGLKKTYEYYVK